MATATPTAKPTKAKPVKTPKESKPKAAKAASTAVDATPSTRPSPAIRRAADLFKQLSDPTRIQLLLSLHGTERNVTELCGDAPGQSQPAVSHHLSLLRHGRLVEPRREGKHTWYSLTESGRELVGALGTLGV